MMESIWFFVLCTKCMCTKYDHLIHQRIVLEVAESKLTHKNSILFLMCDSVQENNQITTSVFKIFE